MAYSVCNHFISCGAYPCLPGLTHNIYFSYKAALNYQIIETGIYFLSSGARNIKNIKIHVHDPTGFSTKNNLTSVHVTLTLFTKTIT